MKLGLIARGEDRGLGHVTWEIHRNLRPARTLLVDLGELARGFPSHPDRFPNAIRLCWDGQPFDKHTEDRIRDWLSGLDVVYSAETFYDWRIVDWCRQAGVRTVLHVMPEFWRCGQDGIPIPDAVWAPTSWRVDHLPETTRLVPVPVALDRLEQPVSERDGPLRVLHVAGHRAAADRNGTQLVLRAAVRMRKRVELTIAGQDRRLPSASVRRGGPVSVTNRPGGIADYWRLYNGFDVLLMPRRYGGLCLPVQEGMAAGLVPVMPDVSPNRDWPVVPVPASMNGTIATQGGVLRMAVAKPTDLAAAVDRLASDPLWLDGRRRKVREWVEAYSWDALRDLWIDELERLR